MNKLIKLLLLLSATAVTTFSQSSRTLINDGVDQYNEGRFNDAEVNFRKSIEKGKQDFIGNFNLGDAYFKQEKYEDALRAYQNALAKADNKNDKAKSYFNIGNTLLKSNKIKESIDAYKNSLKLNPDDEDAKYNLSHALKLLNQQQNQDQNKQNKDDQNKDDKKDDQQNKDNKQNDEKKDNKDQQNQKDQQKNDQEQKQNQQQKQQFSKKEAEAILDAIKNNEKDLQKKLRKKTGVRVKTEKDW